jgi:catechol 2,3-dioxygenase-like lactoylglutathione lyase family enzyme
MAKITALSYVIPVRDLETSVAFYCKAFELQEVYRGDRIVFVGQPNSETAIGILLDPDHAGSGPQNVGVHVDHGIDYEGAIRDVEAAGATILERGEHAAGVPFARIADPDGNMLWL